MQSASIDLVTNLTIRNIRYKALNDAYSNSDQDTIEKILAKKLYYSDYIFDMSLAYLRYMKRNHHLKNHTKTIYIDNFKKWFVENTKISKASFDKYIGHFLDDDFYIFQKNKNSFTLKSFNNLSNTDKTNINIIHKMKKDHPYRLSDYKKTLVLGVYSKPQLVINNNKYEKQSNLLTLNTVSANTGLSIQYISKVCIENKIERLYGFQEISEQEYKHLYYSNENERYKLYSHSNMNIKFADVDQSTGEVKEESNFYKQTRYFKLVGSSVVMTNKVKDILSHKISYKIKGKKKWIVNKCKFKIETGHTLQSNYSDSIDMKSINDFYMQNHSLNEKDTLAESDTITTDTSIKKTKYNKYTVNAYNITTARNKLNMILWDEAISKLFSHLYNKEDIYRYDTHKLKDLKYSSKLSGKHTQSLTKLFNKLLNDVKSGGVYKLLGLSIGTVYKFISTYFNAVTFNLSKINEYTEFKYNYSISKELYNKIDFSFFIMNSSISSISKRMKSLNKEVVTKVESKLDRLKSNMRIRNQLKLVSK